MKITLPESLKDITIKQYQEYLVLCDSEPKEFDLVNGLLRIFCGISNGEDVKEKDRVSLVSDINKALRTGGEFSDKPFDLNGRSYALIPNFDKITGEEQNALDIFGKIEKSEYRISNIKADTLHVFMSILYRERLRDWKGKYSIVGFEITDEKAKEMLSLPMSKVIEIESFFLTIYQDLEQHIQKCTVEEQLREEKLLSSSRSGGFKLAFTT